MSTPPPAAEPEKARPRYVFGVVLVLIGILLNVVSTNNDVIFRMTQYEYTQLLCESSGFMGVVILAIAFVYIVSQVGQMRWATYLVAAAAGFVVLVAGLDLTDEIPFLNGVAIIGDKGLYHEDIVKILDIRILIGLLMAGMFFSTIEAQSARHRIAEQQEKLIQEMKERQQAEDALRLSETKYRTILESIEDGYFEVDPAGTFVFYNDSMCRILGYPPDEMMGMNNRDFMTEESLQDVFQTFNSVYRTGKPARALDWELVRKDGSTCFVETSVSLIEDSDGRPLGFRGIARDVTERKQAEETLRESEERFRALSETITAAVFLHRGGKMFYVNAAAEETFGYSQEELCSMYFWESVHPDDQEAVKRRGQERQDGMSTVARYELRIMTKSREVRWVDLTAKRIDFEGEPAVLGTAFDITARKLAQQELEAANLRIRDTNAQLEAAIERANEMTREAQAANVAKSEFLANMSHEIRTPMNGIIGFAGFLMDTELDPEQREFARGVQTAGNHLMLIINDILDFSKIEAGKLELEALDFNLRTVIEEVADTLAVKAQEKGLELACLIHQNVPSLLKGDPGRLRQVLFNLVGNAIKFTRKGQVVIRVNPLKTENGKRAKVHFAICDTGIGIAEKDKGRLFKTFSQVDASVTRKFGGSGLGLVISKRLAELMGGTIGVESKEGKGSVFWFTGSFETQAQAEELPSDLPAEPARYRILAVDDNATNRQVLETNLDAWRFRHAEAADGAAALAMLREAARQGDPYHAAIIDLDMPERDGAALCSQIKADPLVSNTRLILLTAMGKRGEAERLDTEGISSFLTKPIKQSHLLESILTALGRKEATAIRRPAASTAIPAAVLERNRGIRILLAEDNPMNQEVARRSLAKYGYAADIASDGNEAVAAFESGNYDVILMDVQMPNLSGFDATIIIRKKEVAKGGHVQIIAMTAHVMKGDRERCIEAGMDDYVTKPIEPESLHAVIARCTKDLRVTAPQPRPEPVPRDAAPAERTDVRSSYQRRRALQSAIRKAVAEPAAVAASGAAEIEMSADDRPVPRPTPPPSRLPEQTAPPVAAVPPPAPKPPSAPPRVDEKPPADLSSLMAIADGDKTLIHRLLGMYLSDTEEHGKLLREAVIGKMPGEVRQEAHRIKGASAQIGANGLRDIAFRLENMGKEGKLDGAAEAMVAFDREFNRVCNYLQEQMNQ